MARHGENIYRRKDGRYEGRYVIGKTAGGKTRFGYIYGRQYAEVKRALILKKAEQAHTASHDGACSRRTVADWFFQWMEEEVRGSVKTSSYQTYLNLLQKHILPALGKTPLVSVTPGVVNSFIAAMEGAGLAQSTVKGAYRLLAAAMRDAFEDGLIRKNPCRKIKIQREERAEQRVLTRSEQELLKNAACESENLPVLLSMYTGMRLGEVCALRWSDIDWENKTITISRTVQRVARRVGASSGAKTMLMIGTPKSIRSRRVIPAPDIVLAQLRLLQSSMGAARTSSVPPRPRNPAPCSAASVGSWKGWAFPACIFTLCATVSPRGCWSLARISRR